MTRPTERKKSARELRQGGSYYRCCIPALAGFASPQSIAPDGGETWLRDQNSATAEWRSTNERRNQNRDWLHCYTVTSDWRFDASTIQRFNVAKPFVIRHLTRWHPRVRLFRCRSEMLRDFCSPSSVLLHNAC